MEDLDEKDTKKIANAVKLAQKKTTNKCKGNISRRLPFKNVLSRGPRNDSQRVQFLESLLKHYKGLPRNSAYARHKIKMASKALQILARKRKRESLQDEKDLMTLLAQLDIHDPNSEEMES